MSTAIYEAIRREIVEAMKRGDVQSRDYARVVKAELDRKGDGRPLPDAEAVKILKALRVTAEENQNAFELAFLDRYLPKEMSEEEIEAWIRANVDFSQLKSPMAAVGLATRALGPAAPGERVRRVVERLVKG
ncbi:MAG: GatB/YqeY domain-containing protein [Meiothermus sp.]|uniref:GatB/YqeY domain-containing protein n=1 Tax=Meiothermus sp. TaxID=1955249 RepID=UPI0025D70993|nr:GatB/YqeY domain-containing protein [Meiothermus sp.]MCS7058033.1 GatB/YqeY domain-containing protein [Meiothermus sp.]MCS7194770.1 GatB/YqeY domain-containing protein [Meiothermus sp.]MDW8089949.1 GatB/YqeY domain-containing protein [Meiothermus sp.]